MLANTWMEDSVPARGRLYCAVPKKSVLPSLWKCRYLVEWMELNFVKFFTIIVSPCVRATVSGNRLLEDPVFSLGVRRNGSSGLMRRYVLFTAKPRLRKARLHLHFQANTSTLPRATGDVLVPLGTNARTMRDRAEGASLCLLVLFSLARGCNNVACNCTRRCRCTENSVPLHRPELRDAPCESSSH